MATFISTIEVNKEAYTPPADENTLPLKHVPYIHHPMQFKKGQAEVQALLDSGNKVNAMILVYATSLGLKVRPTKIEAQKVNGSIF